MSAAQSSLLPLTVYGSNISYFTVKLKMYLRTKGIPYRFTTLNGRWMTEPLDSKVNRVAIPPFDTDTMML